MPSVITFQSVEFSYKARYATLGNNTPKKKAVWFVLHGYGQLAQYFIKKFSSLESYDVMVIAPEGLSKFYLEDVSPRLHNQRSANARVGASWMTKENRVMDIENYIRYLDAVYESVMKDHQDTPVTVLGFSQGAATVSRWVTGGRLHFNRLILWAGIFPPDMDFDHAGPLLQSKEVHVVYGNDDAFLNDARFAEMKMITGKLNITPIITTFDGGHDIDSKTLLKFV